MNKPYVQRLVRFLVSEYRELRAELEPWYYWAFDGTAVLKPIYVVYGIGAGAVCYFPDVVLAAVLYVWTFKKIWLLFLVLSIAGFRYFKYRWIQKPLIATTKKNPSTLQIIVKRRWT